jgi:hypothetical protein
MKSVRIAAIGIAIVCLLASGAWAADPTAPAEKDPQNQPHTAVYNVPDLTTDLSKQLVKSLGDLDGIIAAKPDAKAGTFAVTFTPAKTDTKSIEAALASAAPKTSLASVAPADPKAAKAGCGGCPKKSSCAKNKKKD